MDIIFQYTFQLLYIKACVLYLMMLQIHEQTCNIISSHAMIYGCGF